MCLPLQHGALHTAFVCPDATSVAVQASLAWWGEVSPFSPYGPSAALAFVLLVRAVQAIVGDRKRHVEDRQTNNSKATAMERSGAFRVAPFLPLPVRPSGHHTTNHRAQATARGRRFRRRGPTCTSATC